MKYITKLPVIVSLILFLTSSVALGGERLIRTTVDGVGTIVKGNVAAARKKAINNALKKAIEETVQTIVSSAKIAQNEKVLKENIYSKSRGYTSNYKVISENSVGNMYQITVEAQVSTTLLEENLIELGLIASKRNVPRVLLVISHEESDGSRYFWWGNEDGPQREAGEVEKIMARKITESGYVPADKSKFSLSNDTLSIDESEKPSEETFAALANRYNSDMILYGRAYTIKAKDENGADSTTVHAVVSLSLIDGKDGRVVASSENEEITDGDSMEEAFKKTTEILAHQVIKHITAFWQNNSTTVKTVEMNISGIMSYVNFMSFQDALKNKVKGIQEVKQKGFGAGGKAKLGLILKGNVQGLADELTMISYEGFSIDITEMNHNKISIKMKKL
ncbi:MAG: DUF2066 domain-containing protein [Deltaproteobacteria bacterium]|nr:DUF2066 domain-containing protein [Deltaproteobacteria bacterium]